MKKILLILILIPVLLIVMTFVWSLITRGQSAAGIVDGKLTPCPDSPNCVCSEYPEDTAHDHAIEPIQLPEGVDGMAVMTSVIEDLGGTIQTSDETYLAAIFRTKFFRFTDDVEVRLDAEAGVLHIRSASRAGYGDMGLNRERVEEIRAAFAEKAAR